MDGRIDVLGQIDRQIESCRALSSDAYHAQELPKWEAVRAAVVELADAADAFGNLPDVAYTAASQDEAAADRFFEAIANIGASA